MAITFLALRCLALDPVAQARCWAGLLDLRADGATDLGGGRFLDPDGNEFTVASPEPTSR